ncbi:CoA transferase [Actinomadura sp. NBRC 104412]|uniref:CaiB/BaiF CoA transferase family protein n=1 Tax=Actinomadura sp. NBRC 104412 TaxID=3032203 RepID=UPI0024A00603|nr:CoA transferase [Actinomadura sp. NBRC 104412]GLZ07503.1 CoA transferase [Actinomadura sp. NBRC 104412]
MTSRAPGPLHGLRVVDVSTSYAGPSATMYLADLGADVIKVERPGGDEARRWGPPFTGQDAAWFYSANRGKRSVVLDLTAAEGQALLHRMLERADVFVESMSRSALRRLDLAPETIRTRYPRLVYCAISGFGLDGPDASLRGYDLIAQARSGLMSVTGEAGGAPQRIGTAVSDVVTGMVAALAISAAVVRQRETGAGELVDASLLDADLALMAPRIASYLAGEPEPRPSGGTDSVLSVYQAFPTADEAIVVAIGNDAIWRRFCAAIGLPELAADPRLATNDGRRAHRGRVVEAIGARLATRNSAHWLARLVEANVPASAIHGLSSVVADPHLRARGALLPVNGAETGPVMVVGPPWRLGSAPAVPDTVPRAGQHTREVLGELGVPADDLERLLLKGVVAEPVPGARTASGGGA